MEHHLRRLVGREVGSVHLRVHGLHHYDGIIHHDTNGQHQREQRDEIDRHAEHLHEEEGTDQGHGHRQRGNERGTPVSEEDEHHERHEDEGLHQRVQHLFNRGVEEVGDVVADLVIHPRREGLLLELRQLRLDLLDHLVGIAAVALLDDDRRRRVAVEIGIKVIEFAAQLDGSDIFQPQQFSVFGGPQNDVFILLNLIESARVGEHVFQ